MITEEQREARRSGIGGSDVGAIIGLVDDSVPTVPNFTAMDVYLSKVDPTYERKVNSNQRNNMDFGNLIEDFIISMFERKTGHKVVRENTTRQSKTHPWLLGNIDGFIPSLNAILEVKNVDPSKEWKWGKDGTDEIPEMYLLQCAHYAHVYDVDKVYIAAYFGSSRFKVFLYNRNIDLENFIVGKATEFWHENVLKKVPPVSTGLEDYRKLYPEAKTSEPVIADDDTIGVLNSLTETQEKIKELGKVEKDLQAKICELMKDSDLLVSSDGRVLVTWKNQVANRVDTKALKEKYPDIANAVTKQSQSRVMRIKG